MSYFVFSYIIFIVFVFVGAYYVISKDRFSLSWRKIWSLSAIYSFFAPFLLIIIFQNEIEPSRFIEILADILQGIGLGLLVGRPINKIYWYFKRKSSAKVSDNRETKIKNLLMFLENVKLIDQDIEDEISEKDKLKANEHLKKARMLLLGGEDEESALLFFDCMKQSSKKINDSYVEVYLNVFREAYFNICKLKFETLNDKYVWENYDCKKSGISGLFDLSENGYHESTYTIAMYYKNGKFLEENENVAFKLLKRAEEQGSKKAKSELIVYDVLEETEFTEKDSNEHLRKIVEFLE